MRRLGAALAATVAAAAVALTACSSPASSGEGVTPTTLRVGINGGGPGTILDPHVFTDALGTWFNWSFFETIGRFDEDSNYQNVLAESFTPNEDATSWTLVVKDGITFHDGSPLTAADIIFSFQRILDPATGAPTASLLSGVESMTEVDARTVRFDLSAPSGSFDRLLSSGGDMGIIPANFDPASPVSTGPWVFDHYEPGVAITLKRYDGYHGTPAKLDSVSLVALPDADARTNALLSKQIDVDPYLRPAVLPQVEADAQMAVLDLPTAAFQMVTMRVDQGPTADPRVREAIRLAVDREQIITVVDGGHARIGHDLYSIDDPDYRSDLVMTRDVEKAKQLIAEAGATGTAITLYTIQAIEPMAQIVAQNAREIGLDVTVEVRDDAKYYSDGYLEYDVAVDQYQGLSLLKQATVNDGPEATLPYTHFNDPEYNALYEVAMSTLDEATRKEATGKMQEILFERGGYIIPRFTNLLIAAPQQVTGWPAADPTGGVLLAGSLKNLSWES